MKKLFGFLLICGICSAQNLTEQYRATADKLIDAALRDNDGYAKLAFLCDRIGNRLSGSESLSRAIAWGADTMKRDGLDHVQVIPVKVPHWVRGAESARFDWGRGSDAAHAGAGDERRDSAGRNHGRCCGGQRFRRTRQTRTERASPAKSFCSTKFIRDMGRRRFIEPEGRQGRQRSGRSQYWFDR